MGQCCFPPFLERQQVCGWKHIPGYSELLDLLDLLLLIQQMPLLFR